VITTFRSDQDLDYELFVRRIKQRSGIDLGAYKRPQMERRLRALITQAGAASFADYLVMLEKDPALWEAFRKRMTINVSEFFRNEDKFEELASRLLPDLAKSFQPLRIWSAGCSYGAEAYSLAILLEEMGAVGRGARILATDVDDQMLARARTATFAEADLKNVNRLRRCKFLKQGPDGWRVSDRIKTAVEFRHHDLLRDRFESGFHLICCRNVVIYFTDEAKAELYRKFWHSLSVGGILFIGGTEHIFDARAIGLEPVSAFFYRKVDPRAEEGVQCRRY
jgi:chemotaxis protein methyltransferase CheR